MAATLLHKVWESHRVRTLANGQTQLIIGTHLAIVFMAGIYMPPALVAWFQNVAKLLG